MQKTFSRSSCWVRNKNISNPKIKTTHSPRFDILLFILYSCIKYIYDNPVKAGICNNPEDYLYSNYKTSIKIDECEEYQFIDIQEDINQVFKRVIEKTLSENGMVLEELKQDEKELHRLVVVLKRDYKISLRDIANKLKVNREKIRKEHEYFIQ